MRQYMHYYLIPSPEATGGIRTLDLLITNQLLYQLSHGGVIVNLYSIYLDFHSFNCQENGSASKFSV